MNVGVPKSAEDRYGKIAFQGYRSRGKSVERVISAARSCDGVARVRVLDCFRGLPPIRWPVDEDWASGRAGSVGGASRKRPARLLEVRSGRIKSYFNVNAAEASVRAGIALGILSHERKSELPCSRGTQFNF